MALDLDECNARLAWARRRLQRLDEAVTAYKQGEPFTTRQEFTPQEYMASLYVTAKPLPMEISFMAGDVVHNLRSTLDHLAWQLALSTGATSPAFPLDKDAIREGWKNVFFPLRTEHQAGYDWLPKQLQNLRPAFKTFIRDIQPYVASDDPHYATVWMLHELSNVDKHRVALEAVPSIHQIGNLVTNTPYSRVNVQTIKCARVPCRLKQETLVLRVWFDTVPLAPPILDLPIGIGVSFDDALGIPPEMPVVSTLENCASMVDYILIRAKRLGEDEASS